MGNLEEVIKREAIRGTNTKNFRKRFLVSEGELFQLYKDVQRVLDREARERFMADFRELLRNAQAVKLVIESEKTEA